MGSWYPEDPAEINEFLGFVRGNHDDSSAAGKDLHAKAAVSPHAGWYYSGKIAARSVSSLDRTADTVAVIGGHLPAGMPILFAEEDAVRTPFGLMPVDKELREALYKKLGGRGDRYQDNTVEVLLPMVHSFFPKANLLWVRFPANFSSYEAGRTLAETAKTLGRRLAVLGSTDLTHYGLNYGFSPRGSGKAALDWVRNTNDAGFIREVLKNDASGVLHCAEENYSACSAGAVLGVMGFADYSGGLKSGLLDYGTSADVSRNEIPDSFVGYASIAWT